MGSVRNSCRAPLMGVRRRISLGALGILVVLVTGVISLFALHYAQQQQEAVFQRLRELRVASELATDAQIAFKLQVQEWKNTLLRGGDPQLHKHHRAAMAAQGKVVQDKLGALIEARDDPALAEAASAARAAHQTLLITYQQALERFDDGGRAEFGLADAAVRGIDRPFDVELDLLAERLRAAANHMEANAG